jgi:glycosyltransferase involved in cell wall biosynthesis
MAILTVNQFHSGTACGDAITDEMLSLGDVLAGAGYKSNIFAEHIVPELATRVFDVKNYEGNPDNILLIHHSFGFDCFEKIISLPDRKILIYHNITPTEFFSDNPLMAAYARKGREQLSAYRDHVDFAFADSEFNRLELEHAGFQRTGVLPVTFALEKLAHVKTNPELSESLSSSTNFLFVGRLIGNKKQEDVIRTFSYYYHNINRHSRLFLVGGYEATNGYYMALRELALQAGVAGSVFFPGRVTDADLVAYYEHASVFLSMSEHEGFGVPLVESMAFGVPVVAFKAAAVPYTLGGAGVLFTRKEISLIAELVNYIINDRVLRQKILDAQFRRREALRPDRFIPKLFAVIEESSSRHLGSPARASSIAIQIQGPFETSYSLAIVNRNFARALNAKPGVDVALYATEGPGDYAPRREDLADKPDIYRLWRKSTNGNRADCVIRNMYPPRVCDVDPSQLNFFYFYWEDSLVPSEWADDFNRYLDGLMVPSRHVLTALRNSGVAIPIDVIHTGVEVLESRNAEPFNLGSGKAFKFLHVSSGFPRKGCDVLLRAYVKEFSSEDNVCLVIKTFPNIHNMVAEQIGQARSGKPDCPEIVHIDQELDTHQLASLYQAASCFVHPSRAEGFGLPVAEAMLARIPVIVTGYSGLTEFCNDKTALLIDYKLAPSRSHFNVKGAKWAEPDEAHLRERMRTVYENPMSPALREKVDAAESAVRSDFTWDRVVGNALSFVRLVESRAKQPINIGMVTTWNSACGIAEYSRYLIEGSPDGLVNWSIFAQESDEIITESGLEITRCWRGLPENDLSRLLEEIQRRRVEVVHFQFNFGFFELGEFGRAIYCLKTAGLPVLITFHSTQDTVLDRHKLSLGEIAHSLKLVDRIFVHSEADRERLASWGIRANVTRLPHGFPHFEHSSKEQARRRLGISAIPVISTFGFLLPHKGLLELIESLSICKQKYPDLLLLALTALYPAEQSERYHQLCRQRIAEWSLDANCDIVTRFLSPEEIGARLQAADVIVLPYHHTKESSSAAVRFPLASGRPVITTKQAIFDDIAAEVYQIDNSSPQAIAQAVLRLLNDESLAQEIVNRSSRRVTRDLWGNVANMYLRIIRGVSIEKERSSMHHEK